MADNDYEWEIDIYYPAPDGIEPLTGFDFVTLHSLATICTSDDSHDILELASKLVRTAMDQAGISTFKVVVELPGSSRPEDYYFVGRPTNKPDDAEAMIYNGIEF